MKKNNLLKLLLTSVISICMVLAFAGCGNAARAAREAGYSLRNAKRQGYRLLHRADIQTGLYCVNLCVYHERNPAKYPGVDLWEFENIR